MKILSRSLGISACSIAVLSFAIVGLAPKAQAQQAQAQQQSRCDGSAGQNANLAVVPGPVVADREIIPGAVEYSGTPQAPR